MAETVTVTGVLKNPAGVVQSGVKVFATRTQNSALAKALQMRSGSDLLSTPNEYVAVTDSTGTFNLLLAHQAVPMIPLEYKLTFPDDAFAFLSVAVDDNNLTVNLGIIPFDSASNPRDITQVINRNLSFTTSSRAAVMQYIACGNPSINGSWITDTGLFSAGTVLDSSNTNWQDATPLLPGMSQQGNVYRYLRYHNAIMTYTLTGYIPETPCLLRIHSGDQGYGFQQSINVNGVEVQPTYVVQTDAGGSTKIGIKEFTVCPDYAGNVAISFIPQGGGQAAVTAIELHQPKPARFKTVHCAGDSITAGGGVITNIDTWVYQLAEAKNGNVFSVNPTQSTAIRGYDEKAKWNFHITAISGNRIDEQTSIATSYITPFRRTLNEKEAVFLLCGINDILQGASLATLQSRTTAFFAGLAPEFIKGIGTITGTSGAYTLSGGQETIRTQFNTWIKANSLGLNFVVDFNADSRLTNASDTTYFYDGLHCTRAGYTVRANLIRIAIEKQIPVTATDTTKLINTAIKKSDYTAKAGECVCCDSSSGAFTVLAPSGMSSNDKFAVHDVKSSAGTNAVTVSRNGYPINSLASNFPINVNGQYAEFTYVDSTAGLRIAT
jgi:lysophospholipase L1-like esterase